MNEITLLAIALLFICSHQLSKTRNSICLINSFHSLSSVCMCMSKQNSQSSSPPCGWVEPEQWNIYKIIFYLYIVEFSLNFSINNQRECTFLIVDPINHFKLFLQKRTHSHFDSISSFRPTKLHNFSQLKYNNKHKISGIRKKK
jgi:hypothetical protein